MQQWPHSTIFLTLQSQFFTVYFMTIIQVIKSRRMRWTGHVARMGESRGLYRVLVGKPEGKRRPRHRWENNIKGDFQEVECGGIDWI